MPLLAVVITPLPMEILLAEKPAQGISQVRYEGNINANSSASNIVGKNLNVNKKLIARNQAAVKAPKDGEIVLFVFLSHVLRKKDSASADWLTQ